MGDVEVVISVFGKVVVLIVDNRLVADCGVVVVVSAKRFDGIVVVFGNVGVAVEGVVNGEVVVVAKRGSGRFIWRSRYRSFSGGSC